LELSQRFGSDKRQLNQKLCFIEITLKVLACQQVSASPRTAEQGA